MDAVGLKRIDLIVNCELERDKRKLAHLGGGKIREYLMMISDL